MNEAIVWNAWGIENSSTLATLSKMIKKFRPLVLAILEPMLRDSMRLKIGLKLGYHGSFSNDSAGGKIWTFF